MRSQTKLIVVLALVLPTLLMCTSSLFAHDQNQPTPAAKSGQQTSARHDEHDEQGAVTGPARPIPIPFSGNLKKHAHNKIVHFPLALGITGSLFVFLALKRPEMMTAARILWFIGAAVGIAAYFTGTWQEGPFEHGTMHNIFEIHENLGIVSIVSMWVGFILTFIKRLRGLTLLVAIEIAAVVAVTGFYGGVLAH